MVIDILTAIALVAALIKGFQKGFIIAVFSIIAFVAGIAAALKLSASVAQWLGTSTTIGTKWLPFISFVLVFIAVILLVRMGAKFLESAVKLALLGWLNKLLGIVLFALLYIIILSVFLFYAVELHLFADSTLTQSATWPYIKPWAPVVIEKIGIAIPLFKDLFEQLSQFFESVNKQIPAA
jgi:membrane protein required for colicin V production